MRVSYLLSSLKKREVTVRDDMRKSPPLSHAKGTRQLDIPLDNRQVLLLRVTNGHVTSIEVYL